MAINSQSGLDPRSAAKILTSNWAATGRPAEGEGAALSRVEVERLAQSASVPSDVRDAARTLVRVRGMFDAFDAMDDRNGTVSRGSLEKVAAGEELPARKLEANLLDLKFTRVTLTRGDSLVLKGLERTGVKIAGI